MSEKGSETSNNKVTSTYFVGFFLTPPIWLAPYQRLVQIQNLKTNAEIDLNLMFEDFFLVSQSEMTNNQSKRIFHKSILTAIQGYTKQIWKPKKPGKPASLV